VPDKPRERRIEEWIRDAPDQWPHLSGVPIPEPDDPATRRLVVPSIEQPFLCVVDEVPASERRQRVFAGLGLPHNVPLLHCVIRGTDAPYPPTYLFQLLGPRGPRRYLDEPHIPALELRIRRARAYYRGCPLHAEVRWDPTWGADALIGGLLAPHSRTDRRRIERGLELLLGIVEDPVQQQKARRRLLEGAKATRLPPERLTRADVAAALFKTPSRVDQLLRAAKWGFEELRAAYAKVYVEPTG
jgi:hypothetical protein